MVLLNCIDHDRDAYGYGHGLHVVVVPKYLRCVMGLVVPALAQLVYCLCGYAFAGVPRLQVHTSSFTLNCDYGLCIINNDNITDFYH